MRSVAFKEMSFFAFVSFLASNVAYAIGPIKTCGMYQVSGVYRCSNSSSCFVVLYPGTKSETSILVGPPTEARKIFNNQWIKTSVLIESVKTNAAMMSGSAEFVAPNFSSGAVTSLKPSGCVE